MRCEEVVVMCNGPYVVSALYFCCICCICCICTVSAVSAALSAVSALSGCDAPTSAVSAVLIHFCCICAVSDTPNTLYRRGSGCRMLLSELGGGREYQFRMELGQTWPRGCNCNCNCSSGRTRPTHALTQPRDYPGHSPFGGRVHAHPCVMRFHARLHFQRPPCQ